MFARFVGVGVKVMDGAAALRATTTKSRATAASWAKRLVAFPLTLLMLVGMFAGAAHAATFSGYVSASGTAKGHSITLSAPGTISATLNWSTATANLDLSLRTPSGALAAKAATTNRPETLTYRATVAGTWKFVVLAASGASSYTLTASVNTTNRAPVVNADSAATHPDTPVTVKVLGNDSDPDGNPLTVAVTAAPANGTAAVNADQTVTYT